MSTLTKTPLIVETGRGPCIAGTRITVYSVMDYLKGDWSREFIQQVMLISGEQLDAVLQYIAAHQEEVERDYAEIVRRSAELRERYQKIYRERSPFLVEMPPEERRRVLLQRLAEKEKTPQPNDENHDSPRS